MGNAIEKKERQEPRKSRVSQAKEQREERKRRRHVVDQAEWSDVDPLLLNNVISVVAGRGCAIQFGYTRDGGAFAIRIVGDGDPYTEYVRPNENIVLHLTGIIDDFTNGGSGMG